VTPSTEGDSTRQVSLAHRLMPKGSVRLQLHLAALMWFVGATILGVRGAYYLWHSHWAAWLVALALVIGVVKGHLLLERVAKKAVARIRARGSDACLFGFFSWKSWLLIGLMMGGGITLRNSGAPRELLGVLYAAVATGLFYGGITYWRAVYEG
jgi:hypothetical protein